MDERKTLVLTFELPHAPRKIWRALTEPELLARWLMKTDLHPAIGRVFQFRREPTPGWDGVVDCEILAVEECRFISYAWRSLGIDTVVSWTLEPTPAGTLLTLEQSGFKASERQAFGGARMGWSYMAGEQLPSVLVELD